MCYGIPVSFLYFLFFTLVALVVFKKFQNHIVHYGRLGLNGGFFTASASKKGEFEGIPYECHYQPGRKNTPPSMRISILCGLSAKFEIQKEKAWDRLFKNFGVSVEIQTGDSDFDRQYYISTFDSDFMSGYLSDPEKRQIIQSVFARGFTGFRSDGKKLEFVLSPLRDLADMKTEFIEEAVRNLIVLAKGFALPQVQTSGFSLYAEHAWKNSRNIFYAISIFSVVAGFLLLIVARGNYPPLDSLAVFLHSLRFSVPALALFLFLVIYQLKGTAYSHRHLVIIALISLGGFLLSGFGASLWANGHGDLSEIQMHTAGVAQKWTDRSRNQTNYYISFPSWSKAGSSIKLKVSRGLYERVIPQKTQIQFDSKSGKLGFEWISSYEIMNDIN